MKKGKKIGDDGGEDCGICCYLCSELNDNNISRPYACMDAPQCIRISMSRAFQSDGGVAKSQQCRDARSVRPDMTFNFQPFGRTHEPCVPTIWAKTVVLKHPPTL